MRVPCGTWPLGRLRKRWKDNIKMGLRKVGCGLMLIRMCTRNLCSGKQALSSVWNSLLICETDYLMGLVMLIDL